MPTIPVSLQDNLNPAKDVQKYIKILTDYGISEPVEKVCVNSANLQQAAGCLSESYYVTITFEYNRDPLHLFVKSAYTSNQSLAEALQALKAFEKESRFYTEYLPAALEICKSKGQSDLLNIYPNCYFGSEKMIVLENLVESLGYQVEDRQIMFDLDTARSALTTLAKHHAISYAMIKQYSGVKLFFDAFPNLDYDALCQPNMRGIMEPTMEHGLSRNIQIVQETYPDETQCLQKMSSNISHCFDTHLHSKVNELDDPLLVLNHGDYTVNNLLVLKREDHDIVVKPVDFQLTTYSSAILDVSKFMFTSVKSEVRQENLRDLLTLYLHTFQNTTKQLGYDVSLSDEEFYILYRKKSCLGYWFAQCMGSGPIFSVMKDINIYSLGDPSNWDESYKILLLQWMAKHPKKSKEIGKYVVGLFKEFEILNKD